MHTTPNKTQKIKKNIQKIKKKAKKNQKQKKKQKKKEREREKKNRGDGFDPEAYQYNFIIFSISSIPLQKTPNRNSSTIIFFL
jgi:outer membrane biosynthesis protein TonB